MYWNLLMKSGSDTNLVYFERYKPECQTSLLRCGTQLDSKRCSTVQVPFWCQSTFKGFMSAYFVEQGHIRAALFQPLHLHCQDYSDISYKDPDQHPAEITQNTVIKPGLMMTPSLKYQSSDRSKECFSQAKESRTRCAVLNCNMLSANQSAKHPALWQRWYQNQ